MHTEQCGPLSLSSSNTDNMEFLKYFRCLQFFGLRVKIKSSGFGMLIENTTERAADNNVSGSDVLIFLCDTTRLPT